jgi:signal transduction histidine kinase
MKRGLIVMLLAGAVALSAQAYAHHSFAATYLEDQTVTIEGQLVQFLFRNPHSFVHVMVEEEDGAMVRYALREPLTVIQEEAERASNIVKNLLSFARKQDHQRRPTALKPLLDATFLLLRNNLMAYRVEGPEW